MREKKSGWLAYSQGIGVAVLIWVALQFLNPFPADGGDNELHSPQRLRNPDADAGDALVDRRPTPVRVRREEERAAGILPSSQAQSDSLAIALPAKHPEKAASSADDEESALALGGGLARSRHDLVSWIKRVATSQEVEAFQELRHSLTIGRDAGEVTKAIHNMREPDGWVFCTMEGTNCLCDSGITRFGDPDRDPPIWHEVQKPKTLIFCHQSQYGIPDNVDVSPGMVKTCQCRLDPAGKCPDGQPSNANLCPGRGESPCRAGCAPYRRLQVRNSLTTRAKLCSKWVPNDLLWSCDPKLGLRPRKGHKDSLAQEILEISTSRTCEDRALARELEVFLECDFLDNYLKWSSPDSPWIEEAYVTYVGGPKDSRFEKQGSNMIRSVDMFSTRPVVVVIFDDIFVPPLSWQSLPNVIVFRMRPISGGVSFNFNKIRAMLAVRVLVAIQLDTDQLIFTGMDQVFEGTKREIHEHYPWPILPVHWMSRDETPGNPYRHYAFKGWDGPQSMRWVHAHPTWTFWALPWLGDLLQERMQAAKGGKSMMKVWDLQRTRSGIGLYDLLKMGKRAKKDKSVEMSTPTANFMWEDEDMMNVNLWRDQANKTWCKFDLEPALYLVRRGLNQDMYFDPKWYPKGLPILFLSMHNTKGNDPTDWLLRILETCRNEPEELDCPDESVNLMGMCKMGLPEERELRLSPEKFESQVCCCMEPRWKYSAFWNGKWYATLKEVPMTADGSPDGPVRQCIMP